jgi:transcriptional regulator with XRE-family HTH domain
VAEKKKTAAGPKETLGDRIRRHRLAKGLTQAQLGERIGVSQRVVAYYEGKGSSPSPDILVKIADALDVSADARLGRKKGSARAGEREPAVDVRRLRHLKRLDELPLHDRKAIFKIIDALADRNAKRRDS